MVSIRARAVVSVGVTSGSCRSGTEAAKRTVRAIGGYDAGVEGREGVMAMEGSLELSMLAMFARRSQGCDVDVISPWRRKRR